MPPSMRSLPVAAVALLAFLVPTGPGRAQFLLAQTKPMVITSDTVAYCTHLSAQVAEAQQRATTIPPAVPRLATEGRRLCDQGLVRPGIERLRRAWMLLTAAR